MNSYWAGAAKHAETISQGQHTLWHALARRQPLAPKLTTNDNSVD